jgi:hypothetical protein
MYYNIWEAVFTLCVSYTAIYLKLFTTKERRGYNGIHSELKHKKENPKQLLSYFSLH